MIETPEGVRNVDAIAATPGVDAIYIGPGDLALGLGLSAWPERLDAGRGEAPRRHRRADPPGLRRERRRAGHAHRRRRDARRYLEQGFQMVTVANELGLITVGAKAHIAMARGETASAPVEVAAV